MTRKIQLYPHDPIHRLERCATLYRLGFPELFAGDAHKTYQIIKKWLVQLCRSATMNNEDFSIPTETSYRITTLAGLLRHAIHWLSLALGELGNPVAALPFVQEARELFPSDLKIQDDEKAIQVMITNQNQAMEADLENSKYYCIDSRFGVCRYVVYPFMPKKYLFRSEELVKSINDQHKKDSEGIYIHSTITISRSAVQDMTTGTGAPAALGVFATRDIEKNEPLLIDTPAFAVTDLDTLRSTSTKVCENCCGFIPADSKQRCLATCCNVQYCSEKCKNLAWETYHQVLCKKDFDWVWEESKTGRSQYDLDGPMWLRILAACVQSKIHPLEHPLIARLTPLYDDKLYRRWSMSNNIIMPNKILAQLGTDPLKDQRFDTWVLQTIWVRIITNTHLARQSEVSILSSIHDLLLEDIHP